MKTKETIKQLEVANQAIRNMVMQRSKVDVKFMAEIENHLSDITSIAFKALNELEDLQNEPVEVEKYEIVKDVYDLVGIELNKAIEKFGTFNSTHEAFALLNEEVDESSDEMDGLVDALQSIWVKVKMESENELIEFIGYADNHAHKCILELIQVAAMLKKFEMFIIKKQTS